MAEPRGGGGGGGEKGHLTPDSSPLIKKKKNLPHISKDSKHVVFHLLHYSFKVTYIL